MRKSVLTLGVSVVLLSGTASAHFSLTAPPSPTPSPDGKGSPPCGPDVADGTVTPVTGGTLLPLSINETVRHGGFYRVALALKSCKTKGCFPDDNKVYDKNNMVLMAGGPGESDHADYEMTPKFPILGDNLFPHAQAGQGEKYMGTVPLPNINCEKCTLQVIEFMAPHGTNGDAGFFYHHCADLKITADPNKPIFDPMGSGGSGGAGGMGGAGGGGGSSGSATAGGGAGGATAGTGGVSTGGTTGVGTSGTATTAGATTGGTGTTTAGAGGTGTVTNPGSGSSTDDGGCGIATHSRGGASLLAALGLAYALVRRRRAS